MRRAVRPCIATGTALCAALATGVAVSPADAAPADEASIYLVTLDGAGVSGYTGVRSLSDYRSHLLAEQADTLEQVGAPGPIYRWTTALNGFAVELSPDQADEIAGVPGVALVEKNTVRKLAGVTSGATGSARAEDTSRAGGAGVVIGVVDSGIWPESPLFAALPSLGRVPSSFSGSCDEGEEWAADTCNGKVAGARWFVTGFGADNVRTTSSLSPRDDVGHGTQVASVAAGNSGVTVRVGSQALGNYSGVAPEARIAVYKACWTAPDPDNDGCATADVVTAIDRATADGVDVLNLSMAGPDRIDTVERALLGAAEADIFVSGAAGNTGRTAYAGHATPWVTSVAAATGQVRRGEVELADGRSFEGAMLARRPVAPARLVLGSSIAAPGATAEEARLCTPGSLDAGAAAGAVVFCDRGVIGRVDKSRAVRLADGAGMILANVDVDSTTADFHSVPTLQVKIADGDSIRSWVTAHPGTRVTLRPRTDVGSERRTVTTWSASGNPEGPLVKPDLVTQGSGVLGAAAPATSRAPRWNFFSGSSAAAAQVSGQAAVLLGRRDWSAPWVRSALLTSSASLGGEPTSLRQGSGRSRATTAIRPGLVFDVKPGDYRRYLDGELAATELNTPSIMLHKDRATVVRRVTNAGTRHMYYSAHAYGFDRHRVTVRPAALRIAPGETRTFKVTTTGSAPRHVDSGWVAWRGANNVRVRIPVVIAR